MLLSLRGMKRAPTLKASKAPMRTAWNGSSSGPEIRHARRVWLHAAGFSGLQSLGPGVAAPLVQLVPAWDETENQSQLTEEEHISDQIGRQYQKWEPFRSASPRLGDAEGKDVPRRIRSGLGRAQGAASLGNARPGLVALFRLLVGSRGPLLVPDVAAVATQAVRTRKAGQGRPHLRRAAGGTCDARLSHAERELQAGFHCFLAVARLNR